MIRQRVSFVVAGAIVASTALTVGLAGPASAVDTPYDPGFVPAAGDLVGVGSDTIEIALNNIAKGANGSQGFNAGPAAFDIASFAAAGTPADVVLRSGATAVPRASINGSGAGKSKLFGPGNNTDVSFARSSSSLSSAEVSANLQQFPFAVDGLKLAVSSSSTNAPATISSSQLVQIYSGDVTNWSQLGGSPGVIKPLIPQAGSGTRSFFVAELKKANNGVDVALAPSVADAQEHDDTLVKNDANAIAPFSTARAKGNASIKLEKGFKAYRAVYNVARAADLADPVLGAKLDAVFGEGGFICSTAAKPLIEAAGFDQLATSANGGVCGIPTQSAVTSFVTTSQVDTDTTLAADQVTGNKVKLTATIDASTSPEGTVQFKEGANNLGAPVEVTDGSAATTLDLVAIGSHDYSATFTPADPLAFTTSTSGTVSFAVKTPAQVKVGLVNPTGTYGSTRLAAISATVDGEPATGAVSVKVDNGAAVSVNLTNGFAFYTVPGTSVVGAHTVTATLAGTASVDGDSATTPLTVTKATTKTTFKFASASIKASSTPKATVTVVINGSTTVKPSGKVTLKYGSKTVGTGTVTNGVATVSLIKFKKKSSAYGIKATFTSTNPNYSSSPASATVNLKVS